MSSSLASDDVSLDISSLAATLQTKLNAPLEYSSRRCIHRVPKLLRQANEQAYTPALVAIGPLHHNNEKLLPMEVHKVKYLQSFLCDPQANTEGLLNSCLRKVKEKEAEIREFYADPINLSSKDFCEMVLLDSAFVIQIFRKCIGDIVVDEYLGGNHCLVNSAFRDIVWLEENQLPFFILEDLYKTAFQTNATSSNSVRSFTEIAYQCLGINSNVGEMEYLNILHMFIHHRRCITIADEEKGNRINDSPSATKVHDEVMLQDIKVHGEEPNNESNDEKENRNKDWSIPPATKLYEAGVKFKAIKDSATNLLDIKFDNKKWILKMPTLSISDNFESEFRNMVAFEQCNGFDQTPSFITDYLYFLDCLINSPEDVQLLAKAEIIQDMMGSPQQVSELINSLGTHVATSTNYYYEKIASQLKDHCKKRWPRYRATLMHTYFKHPWAAISVVYAIILLIFTFAQVVSGIMAIPMI